MDNCDIPILKKTYELYKTLYGYRSTVNKQDRYSIWQRCDTIVLDILEGILVASQAYKSEKLPVLERTSVKLNILRVFIRLMKEVRVIDNRKYVVLQGFVDEIGRMLGGWMKSAREQ